MESRYIHKSHNVSVLMYHYVCPAKYRRVVFSAEADKSLREICIEIEDRYEVRFLEIGTDKDHVHFLVQAVPRLSPTTIIRVIKSITAREMFSRHKEIKEKLWGGEFWSDGYYVNTVSRHGNENVVANYVKEQGKEKEYKRLYSQQLAMW